LKDREAVVDGEIDLRSIGRRRLVDDVVSHLRQLILDQDLPPGTADLQEHVARTLALSGAIVVVGPQDAAHLDAKRVVEHFQTLRVRVIGGVENMSGLECPHCGELIDVFPPVSGERSLWSIGVAKLASLPLDPSLAGPRQNGDVPESFRTLARTLADRDDEPEVLALALDLGRPGGRLPSPSTTRRRNRGRF